MKATKQVYTFRLSKEAIQVIEQQPGKNRTSQLEHLIFPRADLPSPTLHQRTIFRKGRLDCARKKVFKSCLSGKKEQAALKKNMMCRQMQLSSKRKTPSYSFGELH